MTLNGRTYRLRCEDGEEQRLFALAEHVREKVDQLVRDFGQIGDDRLLLMASLLVADELFEARERLAALESRTSSLSDQRMQHVG
ncbi:MAG: cell division protein ZapA [Hyphomicrobiaceae bacterium]